MRISLPARLLTILAIASLVSVLDSVQAMAGGRRVKVACEHATFEWFFLPIDAAKHQGIWEKHGIEPEFVPAPASAEQIRDRVISGIELGVSNTAEVTLARFNGVPVKTVAGYFGETGARIFVAADGPIRDAKQLDHKKIGIVAASHTSARTVLYMNKVLNIEAEAVPLGSLSNNITALKSGQIEAVYSSEGAALAFVKSRDLRLLLPLAEIYPKPYTAVVVWATDELVGKDPDLVTRFVRAILESVRYLKDNPAYASDLYMKRTGAPKDLADQAVASLNTSLTPGGRGSGNDLVAAVAGNWRFMTQSGAASSDKALNIESVVDTRFLP